MVGATGVVLVTRGVTTTSTSNRFGRHPIRPCHGRQAARLLRAGSSAAPQPGPGPGVVCRASTMMGARMQHRVFTTYVRITERTPTAARLRLGRRHRQESVISAGCATCRSCARRRARPSAVVSGNPWAARDSLPITDVWLQLPGLMPCALNHPDRAWWTAVRSSASRASVSHRFRGSSRPSSAAGVRGRRLATGRPLSRVGESPIDTLCGPDDPDLSRSCATRSRRRQGGRAGRAVGRARGDARRLWTPPRLHTSCDHPFGLIGSKFIQQTPGFTLSQTWIRGFSAAVAVGFEPTEGVNPHTLSRRAP